jgi:Flp pilus assembly protein TadB
MTDDRRKAADSQGQATADDPSAEQRHDRRRPPLQFRLRTMLVVTAAFSLLFATLRWLGVPPHAGFVVLAVICLSVLAAILLVVVIAGSVTDRDNDEER